MIPKKDVPLRFSINLLCVPVVGFVFLPRSRISESRTAWIRRGCSYQNECYMIEVRIGGKVEKLRVFCVSRNFS